MQNSFIIPTSVANYRNIGEFLEKADGRTNHYKKVETELKRIAAIYGNASKEVNDFFLTAYQN